MAVLSTILASIPFVPVLPQIGLDASWKYAVAEVVNRHLVFGRDFVFTFGPWGSVYTRLYHPATDLITMTGGAILGAALATGTFVVARARSIAPLIILPVVIVIIDVHDAASMAIPFFVLIACFQVAEGRIPQKRDHAALAVVLIASGLLPLIKGSYSGIDAACIGISALLAIRVRAYGLLAALALVPLLSMCVGWVVAGQELSALPGFFISQKPIIAGYSGAMAMHGPFSHLVSLALADAAFLAAVLSIRGNCVNRALLVIGVVAFLFISYKAGYVRQDGHDLIPAAALLLAVLACADLVSIRLSLSSGVVALLAWAFVLSAFGNVAVLVSQRLESVPRGVVDGIRLRVEGMLPQAFADANAAIRAEAALPPLTGTTDSYPTELSVLFAHGLAWSGRPVPQSYSAYTPEIDRLNAAHLLGPSAPRNVLWKIGAIDGRLPSLEDASSWPLLVTQYKVASETPMFVVLRHRDDAAPTVFRRIGQTTLMLNQPIDIPRSETPVIVAIDMRETLLGRLARSAFRLPRVYIETTLENGIVLKNLYIPEMGKPGFILSPYAGLNSELVLLSEGSQKLRAVRFKIIAPEIGLWKRQATVTFTTFNVPKDH